MDFNLEASKCLGTGLILLSLSDFSDADSLISTGFIWEPSSLDFRSLETAALEVAASDMGSLETGTIF